MSDPPANARPHILWPLLIALVFLAVIGGSVGLVLGVKGGDSGGRSSLSPPESSPSPSTSSAAPSPTASPSVPRCPAQSEELAGRELARVLYVRTEKSEAWICEAGDGAFFYQGHNGQSGEELVKDVNAIFLTDVVPTAYGYLARNTVGDRTTEYQVSPSQLVIKHPDGAIDTQPAITS